VKVCILDAGFNLKVILRRAVHVDEEVLGHIFNIVVLNVIILGIIELIIRNIVCNMWETHLISIEVKLLTILMRKSLIMIKLWVEVWSLVHHVWHVTV
jgi:hypothetical protein